MLQTPSWFRLKTQATTISFQNNAKMIGEADLFYSSEYMHIMYSILNEQLSSNLLDQNVTLSQADNQNHHQYSYTREHIAQLCLYQ